ncbi:unnamed protein product [Choristocarpus tenellus]
MVVCSDQDGNTSSVSDCQGEELNDHLWSARLLIDNPSLIRDTHISYFRAGADVATTASYQASYDGFKRKGISHAEGTRLMGLSVQLALEARSAYVELGEETENVGRPFPIVAASLGCYGASLADGSEYRGNYSLSVEELKEWHRDRAKVMAGAGADILVFETIPCLDEVIAVLELLEDFPRAEVVISVSCKDGEHLRSGEPLYKVAEVFKAMDSSQDPRKVAAASKVVGLGINCTSPEHIAPALHILKETVTVPEDLARTTGTGETRAQMVVGPGSGQNLTHVGATGGRLLVVYPNSGEGWDAEAKSWVPREWYHPNEGGEGEGRGGCRTKDGSENDLHIEATRSDACGDEELFGQVAVEWFRLGARVIGGCCRTRPAIIGSMRMTLTDHILHSHPRETTFDSGEVGEKGQG